MSSQDTVTCDACDKIAKLVLNEDNQPPLEFPKGWVTLRMDYDDHGQIIKGDACSAVCVVVLAANLYDRRKR